MISLDLFLVDHCSRSPSIVSGAAHWSEPFKQTNDRQQEQNGGLWNTVAVWARFHQVNIEIVTWTRDSVSPMRIAISSRMKMSG